MQFHSGSIINNSGQAKDHKQHFQQNLNLMMAQHQQLMQVYYNYSQNNNFSFPFQALPFYNPKPSNNVILVGREDHNKEKAGNMTAASQECSEDHIESAAKNAIQCGEQSSKKHKAISHKTKAAPARRKKIYQSEEEYEPDYEEPFDLADPRISQSKNIPKIFGKGIINFISKNKGYSDRVLSHFGVDETEFELSLQHFKKNISSIADLRSMWVAEGNKFAKIYRVLSKEYLRKHSLPYIFNSRVTSVNKHIKYRHKISNSIETPETFTSMKQY